MVCCVRRCFVVCVCLMFDAVRCVALRCVFVDCVGSLWCVLLCVVVFGCGVLNCVGLRCFNVGVCRCSVV